MNYFVLALIFLVLNVSVADEFSELKAKKLETIANDPFANRTFYCESTTESGLKMTERWSFFKTSPTAFTRDLGGIVKKGTYRVEDGLLKLKETSSSAGLKQLPSDKEWEYKYKITAKGFEYIHEAKGKKLLHECVISGSTVR